MTEFFYNLEKIVRQQCIIKNENNDYPASVVGASYLQSFFIDKTGFPPPPLADQLELKLKKLGKLGDLKNGNLIGKCVEESAANKLLRSRKKGKPEEIQFTTALRPRTMQKVPMCKNCHQIFNK